MFVTTTRFPMHQGWKCTGPIELPHARLGDVPKVASLGLGRGVNAFLCSVSCWQSVKIHEGLLKMYGFQNASGATVSRPHQVAAR